MSLHIAVEEGVAHIQLDSPPHNLLSNQIKEELTEAFSTVSKNSEVRVIYFDTAGDHFCSGANLKEFPERIRTRSAGTVWDKGHDMLRAILQAPQPTVACVRGNALGGGAELASAFDIRVFADNVRVGYPEVLRGVFPGNGGFERLIDLVGEGRAAYLLYTGAIIGAEEAFRLGLATHLVPLDRAREEARSIAATIAANPRVAVFAIKQALLAYRKGDFFPTGRKLFEHVHDSDDVLEAVNAFLEKRSPVFRHR